MYVHLTSFLQWDRSFHLKVPFFSQITWLWSRSLSTLLAGYSTFIYSRLWVDSSFLQFSFCSKHFFTLAFIMFFSSSMILESIWFICLVFPAVTSAIGCKLNLLGPRIPPKNFKNLGVIFFCSFLCEWFEGWYCS